MQTYGLVRWTYYILQADGTYQQQNQTIFNDLVSGGAPTPYFPCGCHPTESNNEMTHPLPSCKGWVYGCWSSAAGTVETKRFADPEPRADTRRFMALVWSSAPDRCAMRHREIVDEGGIVNNRRCGGRWPFLTSTKSVRCGRHSGVEWQTGWSCASRYLSRHEATRSSSSQEPD
jgi:hypothetical protein